MQYLFSLRAPRLGSARHAPASSVLLLAALGALLAAAGCSSTAPVPAADAGPRLRFCAADTDCEMGDVCEVRVCVPRCTATAGCGGDAPVCDVATGRCVECGMDADCDAGRLCEAHECVARRCEPGELSCQNAHIILACNPRGDGYEPSPCEAGTWCLEPDLGGRRSAACLFECPPALTDCDGSCRDTTTDTAHCGACGSACASGEVCSTGACARSCEVGLTACAGSCRDLGSDRANCGACGTSCDPGDVCTAGVCTRSCETDLTECSGSCRDLRTDRANCGACGVPCAVGELCVAGSCATECPPGQVECATGCRDLTSSETDCGACEAACPGGANAVAACAASRCGLLCDAGFADCDASAATGCEADLATSSAHCGACGAACGAGEACVAGVCTGGPVDAGGGLDGGGNLDGGGGNDAGNDDAGGGIDAGVSSDAGAMCVPSCTTDSECATSCPPNPRGANCCDAIAGICYASMVAVCPVTPPPDSGLMY